jgi:hypothetical protein
LHLQTLGNLDVYRLIDPPGMGQVVEDACLMLKGIVLCPEGQKRLNIGHSGDNVGDMFPQEVETEVGESFGSELTMVSLDKFDALVNRIVAVLPLEKRISFFYVLGDPVEDSSVIF